MTVSEFCAKYEGAISKTCLPEAEFWRDAGLLVMAERERCAEIVQSEMEVVVSSEDQWDMRDAIVKLIREGK